MTGVGGLNQPVTVSYSGDCLNVTVANGCTATANFAGDANHNGSSDSKSITIEKASSTTTVTFEAGPYTYRGTAFTATAAVTGVGGLNQPVTVSYSGDCLNVTVANGCTAMELCRRYKPQWRAKKTSESNRITIIRAFAFNGFYSPIGGSVENGHGGSYADPVKSFKLGSTIPVKFGATWLNGGALLTGIDTLQAVKYSNATDLRPSMQPNRRSYGRKSVPADRYEWHFNLSTKGFTAGTWLLRATLVDGSEHTVWITIKK